LDKNRQRGVDPHRCSRLRMQKPAGIRVRADVTAVD